MKTISLALALALTAVIGFAQPVLAQSLDQSGSSNQRSAGNSDDMDRGGAMTSGQSRSDDHGSWRGRRDEDSSGPGRTGSGERHGGGMEMRRGQMERHHQMMMGATRGARFRFTRGDARIDVQCPAQENLRACVAAATELLDKIVSLHGDDRHQSKATGSGSTPPTSGSDLNRGRAPGADQQDEDIVPGPGHDSNLPDDQM